MPYANEKELNDAAHALSKELYSYAKVVPPLTDDEQEAMRMYFTFKKQIKHGGYNIEVKNFEAGREILEAPPAQQLALLSFLLNRKEYDWKLDTVENALLAKNLPIDAPMMEKLLTSLARQSGYRGNWSSILRMVERFIGKGNTLSEEMQRLLRVIRDENGGQGNAEGRKVVARISELLGETVDVLPDAGETWSDKARADYHTMTPQQQAAWSNLFAYALLSDASKPSGKWRKDGAKLVEAVGADEFDAHVSSWFNAVTSPTLLKHEVEEGEYDWNEYIPQMTDANLSLLKGLAWLCADRAGSPRAKDIARALAKLITACLKKIPGVGPWGTRAATGAIWALTEMGTMDAVGQLGILKTKISFRTALNAIENGLEAAAKKAGVTKADLEDLGVPTYGFGSDGKRIEEFGDSKAEATLSPLGEISVQWFGANGKAVKSVPAEVKKEYAAELKEFKADMDSAAKTLTAQKQRFDGFYIPARVWKLSDWRERFGDHPLVGNIAHRLIWHFSDGDQKAQGLYHPDSQTFHDVAGKAIDWLHEETEVRLWHPIGFDVAEVVAWRNRLQELGITQPFKQAYREVYILTEAELRTHTYSNRFAGHILKQHQMNALAALRGWKNQLRLAVDASYSPASKTFPDYGIRAEFWIEAAGDYNDNFVTESGTYLYLTTDQVRFYREGAPENWGHSYGGGYTQEGSRRDGSERNPLPLTEVPALLFSEVMRDVDMFVGVSSVGNDPTWRDGGTAGAFNDYWTDYSFGDLSATAQTRRAVLEKLLPRLKIASKCELTDKFLVVRGSIRTYKIHLGSANILMEPNDQYLCIVEERGSFKPNDGTTFLPYEGDHRLAIILSKAFLLADDAKITDVTITRQIAV
jgi:hypothetical protein